MCLGFIKGTHTLKFKLLYHYRLTFKTFSALKTKRDAQPHLPPSTLPGCYRCPGSKAWTMWPPWSPGAGTLECQSCGMSWSSRPGGARWEGAPDLRRVAENTHTLQQFYGASVNDREPPLLVKILNFPMVWYVLTLQYLKLDRHFWFVSCSWFVIYLFFNSNVRTHQPNVTYYRSILSMVRMKCTKHKEIKENTLTIWIPETTTWDDFHSIAFKLKSIYKSPTTQIYNFTIGGV